MHKSFSFKGVSRNTDNLVAADGECLDIVNLRISGGTLVPVPVPDSLCEIPAEYSAVYRHELPGHYIAVSVDGSLHLFTDEWQPLYSEGKPVRFNSLKGVERIEFLGNLVCCFTATGISYILYSSGCYRLLGERPPVPQLNVSVESKVSNLVTDASFYVTTTVDNVDASWRYNELGYINECIANLNREGYYIDRALFKFALRLYDGSYIYCSQTIYVSDDANDEGVGRDAVNMQSESLGSSDGLAQFRVKVRGFKPTFSFSEPVLENWKGIVVGIDLFSSGSIYGKHTENKQVRLSNPQGGTPSQKLMERYVAKTPEELHNDISSVSLFYKVAEFDIEGNMLWSIDDVSQTNIVLQQSLSGENSPTSLATLSAGCSYMLNNRLHIASLKEWFFKGYDPSALLPVGCGSVVVDRVVVHTVLETSGGTYTVVNDYGEAAVGERNGILEISPFLSYPDRRAVSMRIYIDDYGSIRARTFTLVPHANLNQAQYIHKWSSPYSVDVTSQFSSGGTVAYVSDKDVLAMFNEVTGVHEVVYSASLGYWTYLGNRFPQAPYNDLRIFAIYRDIADGDKIIFTISMADTSDEFVDVDNIPIDSSWETVSAIPDVGEVACEARSNVVKVSAVDNPFLFPPETTYTPSQGSITALSSNTVALSQGQSGQHPLYIFSTDGIWALTVDASGTVAYSGCFPLSRERCMNPSTVCGVDVGVVFAGDQGLMLLRGSSIKKLSGSLDDNAICSPVLASAELGKVAALVGLDDVTESVPFATYLKESRIAYLAQHNEIIVSNAAYRYSYLFSLEQGVWSRIDENIAGFVNDSRRFLFFSTGAGATRFFAYGVDERGSNKVLLFTRPQLWGTKLPKRVMQLMVHASVSPPGHAIPGVTLLACYMLGSNDGVNYRIVAGCETCSACRDISFPYYPTQSYRYFLFAIAGNPGKDSILAGLELEIIAAWNNRMG